jgi:GNAT superfamily N-acetyltransferase
LTLAVLDAAKGSGAFEAFRELGRDEALAGLERSEFVGRQRVLVARRDGRPAARLVARLSLSLQGPEGLPVGMLGFFEALDDPEAVSSLFAEGISWLHKAGAGRVIGPMDGDTWHRYRLNVGPWDDPPFLLEPVNPPYYQRLWEGNGFRVLSRYFSKRVPAAAVVEHLEARSREALAAGYRLRPIDLDRFEDELAVLYRLSRESFRNAFLYTDVPEEEFLALYRSARPLLDPDLVLLAQAPDGRDVGFLFAYPDRGGVVDFKTMGVLPGHRRAGVAAALFHRGHRAAVEKGFAQANHCLIREGNPSALLDGGAGRVMRWYCLYEWAGEMPDGH